MRMKKWVKIEMGGWGMGDMGEREGEKGDEEGQGKREWERERERERGRERFPVMRRMEKLVNLERWGGGGG